MSITVVTLNQLYDVIATNQPKPQPIGIVGEASAFVAFLEKAERRIDQLRFSVVSDAITLMERTYIDQHGRLSLKRLKLTKLPNRPCPITPDDENDVKISAASVDHFYRRARYEHDLATALFVRYNQIRIALDISSYYDLDKEDITGSSVKVVRIVRELANYIIERFGEVDSDKEETEDSDKEETEDSDKEETEDSDKEETEDSDDDEDTASVDVVDVDDEVDDEDTASVDSDDNPLPSKILALVGLGEGDEETVSEVDPDIDCNTESKDVVGEDIVSNDYC